MLQLIKRLQSVTNEPQLDIPDILNKYFINILQYLHGQSSHFQVLRCFLKRAREAASRISIGTFSQSWLARCAIASIRLFQ